MTATRLSGRRELHYGARVVECALPRPAGVDALLRSSVDAFPDREAVVSGERRLTYAALESLVARLAASLSALGLGRGDRIAIMLPNSLEFVGLLFAAARIGAISVPISTRETAAGLLHLLRDCEAAAIVASETLAPLVPSCDEVPSLAHRLLAGALDRLDALPQHGLARHAPDVAEEDVACILYTSGTTGRPKGATLTGLGIVHAVLNYRDAFGLGPDDCTIVPAPMTHVTGMLGGVFSALSAGGKLVIEQAFDARRFVDLAARERMTFTVMVPAMYNLILQRVDLSRHDLSAWRVGGFGGAPMPAPTIERLAARLPRLGLMNCYGATETTAPVIIMPAAHTAGRRLSIGRSVRFAQTLVMDDHGSEVAPGQHGELWHGGPSVVPGYWRNPEATTKEFAGGWWKSGDIGSRDDEGFFYLHDRRKDVINRGGYKVYTAAVEGALLAVPGVMEAAVIAKPCPILGERVHAVLVVSDPASFDERAASDQCAPALPDYQRPESFSIRTEPLPRNANGKVLKRKLRQELGFDRDA